jgi:serine/threonine protein kinase
MTIKATGERRDGGLRRADPRRAPTRGFESDAGNDPSALEPVVAAPPPLPARLGHYRLLREIGRGGMGVVHEAEHEVLRRHVALKTITPGREAPRRVERFLAEARTAAQLRHPHIVAILDAGIEDGRVYMVMDLIDGPSVEDVLRDNGPLPAAQAIGVAASIARALAYAHGEKIVHRDVKPGNILLDRTGRPYLADFGLAHDLTRAFERTERPQGTPTYMAPEQMRGEPVGPAADIYGLGVTLYEALTGRTPFRCETLDELRRAVETLEPQPPSHLAAGVSEDLDAVVLACLARRPEDRYSDAESLAKDLDRALRGDPVSVRPLTRREKMAQQLRRGLRKEKGRIVSFTGAAVLMLLLGAVASAARPDDLEADRTPTPVPAIRHEAPDGRRQAPESAALPPIPRDRARGVQDASGPPISSG